MLGWLLNLGFAGGGSTARAAAGGGGRRRRRISIEGRLYEVGTPEEEAELLRQWLASLKHEVEAAPTVAAEKKARIVVRRVAKRLEKAEDRAERWRRQVESDDDEILSLYSVMV